MPRTVEQVKKELEELNNTPLPTLEDSGDEDTRFEVWGKKMEEREEKTRRLQMELIDLETPPQSLLPKKEAILQAPVLLSELKIENYKREWIWEGYIARGFITLFSAMFKSGKSTFLRAMLKAMQTESEFPYPGQPTTKVGTLLITEEATIDWVEKREEFDFPEDAQIWILSQPFVTKINVKGWQDFIKEQYEFCIQNEIHFVIFDTISNLWPVVNENDATDVNNALRPLYIFTKNNIGVLIVQHDNKQGGLEGRSIRGSSALPGFVDMILLFTRLEGSNIKDRKRLIKTYGRFNEGSDDFVIEFQEDNSYVYRGNRYEVSKAARIEAIIEILKTTTDSLGSAQIHDSWDESRFGTKLSLRTIQRYLEELIYKDIVFITNLDDRDNTKKLQKPLYALKEGYAVQTTMHLPGVSLAVGRTGLVRHDSGIDTQVDIPEWKDPDPRV